MNKIYSLFLVPVFWLSIPADCNSSFDSNHSKGTSGNYSISLKLKSGTSGDFTFVLYDLNTGIETKSTTAYMVQGQDKPLFEDVKPSTYAIYYYSSECPDKKALPGKGITLQ